MGKRKTHYKWPFLIAMLVITRGYILKSQTIFYLHPNGHHHQVRAPLVVHLRLDPLPGRFGELQNQRALLQTAQLAIDGLAELSWKFSPQKWRVVFFAGRTMGKYIAKYRKMDGKHIGKLMEKLMGKYREMDGTSTLFRRFEWKNERTKWGIVRQAMFDWGYACKQYGTYMEFVDV